ncbi:hypothetical protein B0H17DRAFT_1072496 [Mycena rosella]|uniref:Uncharacterized protein n=1 Tax=Mycena rosella TaxID=1033263 RepID=A0AAD7D9W7_MYCRO|nr:hypothetical protein B0H17DRAFT_1072496 [Mycena rosella]
MQITYRTSAIIWAVAFLLDVTSVIILTVSIIISPHRDGWFRILMLVFLVFCAAGAAFTSVRWWRLHKAQTQASIPYYGAPPPAVPAR